MRSRTDFVYSALTGLALLVGGALVLDAARSSSATYDEVTYLRVAAQWWRTGEQESITRMGSPLGFWKIQQAPTLWLLDRSGRSKWIDDPDRYQSELLPWIRGGCAWLWATALLATACWARRLHGPRAMAMAAWLFALSPNLVAHGSLATMEMPLIAFATASGLVFSIFLSDRRRWALAASAALAGVAFTCKFTAILIPPLCMLCWLIHDSVRRDSTLVRTALRAMTGTVFFVIVMLAVDLLITNFATLPLSERVGAHPSLGGSSPLLTKWVETPIPQDWVGFATQLRHQRSGGPSYLLGERRMTGWWYYYFVAMAVKIPPVFWLLVIGRLATRARNHSLLIVAIAAYLILAAAGSSRNYGVRYVLPIAPLAIVWVSALANGPIWSRGLVGAGLLGYAFAIGTTHPRELTYFPQLVGGAEGGRRILADSNLDWGQGLRDLAQLQRDRPEFRDLTLYYFGLADPAAYGITSRAIVIDAGDIHADLPDKLTASTKYVAVSASLQFGPWGPEGYFKPLQGIEPAVTVPDFTIAIYETSELSRQ